MEQGDGSRVPLPENGDSRWSRFFAQWGGRRAESEHKADPFKTQGLKHGDYEMRGQSQLLTQGGGYLQQDIGIKGADGELREHGPRNSIATVLETH